MNQDGWRFWIDRGGTFTDVVARSPDGGTQVRKLLSECPERYEDAALQAIRDCLQLAADQPIPAERVAQVRMGTTVATNALLERRGEPCLWVTTLGFGDALRIGYQARPELFALRIQLPCPLYDSVLEVAERVGAQGQVLQALDLTALRAGLQAAAERGLRACAIALLHAWRNPEHERQAAAIAAEVGFTQISLSHECSPLIKLVSRAETTVVDAYLSPVLRRYVSRVQQALGDAPLLFMQSNGGLVAADAFRGKDAVLSGPAGGVVGAVQVAQRSGFSRVIGFDMGGTSTDVCHYAGQYERVAEARIAGVRLRTPMMQVHTVAAGGGSRLFYDGGRLRVGPESAGSRPGPACYGNGGPLTVTDANLLVGRIDARHFPQVFGPQGDQPLDVAAAASGFAALASRIRAEGGPDYDPRALAEGFLRVAEDTMAHAIRRISTDRGHDLDAYALCAFGGAGGQHACGVAEALGLRDIVLDPLSGVLSAVGIGLAELRQIQERALGLPFTEEAAASVDLAARDAGAAVQELLSRQGIPPERQHCQMRLRLRYAGTDAPLELDLRLPCDPGTLSSAFHDYHRRRYGFARTDQPLIADSLAVEAEGQLPGPGHLLQPPEARAQRSGSLQASETLAQWLDGRSREVPVIRRSQLAPGACLEGPALITESIGTIVVAAGWQARVDAGQRLLLHRPAQARSPSQPAEGQHLQADPVRLELFNRLFMAIAERMGTALEQTSQSVNIRERLDFSCALFDAEGALIANAPHMPVHLGSMGDSVRAVRAAWHGRLRDGQVFAINAPYNGGTHLPDITVVTPVFIEGGTAPDFWVASRGHHADIGGITPGSMPPQSTRIDQEGVLLDAMLIVEDGHLLERQIRAQLGSGPWPARNPDQNLADLGAQIAANRCGAEELRAAAERYGTATVAAYMRHVQDHAAAAVRRALGKLRGGHQVCMMDDGARIEVRVQIDPERAIIDFSGTSSQRPNNFNAPMSICKAAVLYVFRSLIDEDIPLNDGCLRPLELRVPEGSMLRPVAPAAVVAGNVETSQCIVDALYGALGIMAAAQGTMNNFTFGNAAVQYYETICGGSGAGPGWDGASAVQTHMTNSRLTDPEVLELRFPVRLETFEIRKGSGGEGRWRGGDGVRRRLRFLEPVTAGLLANRRQVAPFGLAGGRDGQCGSERILRADGSVEPLPPGAPAQLRAGDAIEIETPGGGGYGRPQA
jgi:5-oxoprolinase (ATP-hydrolysing)